MIRGGRPKGRPPALILPGAAASSVQMGRGDSKRGADDDTVVDRFGEGAGEGKALRQKAGKGAKTEGISCRVRRCETGGRLG